MNRVTAGLASVLVAFTLTACGGGTTQSLSSSDGGGSSAPDNGGSGNGGGGSVSAQVTLQWVAPTTRTDGGAIAMSEIGGYRIYYGPSANDTPNFVDVEDETASQYTITLESGTYYFRVSAYDADGIEGPKTSAITQSI